VERIVVIYEKLLDSDHDVVEAYEIADRAEELAAACDLGGFGGSLIITEEGVVAADDEQNDSLYHNDFNLSELDDERLFELVSFAESLVTDSKKYSKEISTLLNIKKMFLESGTIARKQQESIDHINHEIYLIELKKRDYLAKEKQQDEE